MNFKKTNSACIVRLDKGEEAIESLKKLCEQEKITLGSISGIGAANKVIIGFFYPDTKQYKEKVYQGNYEIAALAGNITTMNGKPYIHAHITLGDESCNSISGHCKACYLSTTCEIIIQIIDPTINPTINQASPAAQHAAQPADQHAAQGAVKRKFSEEIGLNLMEF